MKDKRKIEILLKVIEIVYTKNPGMQKLVDKSMIDLCKEGVSPEQVFFVFALGFIVMGYLNIFFFWLRRTAYENTRVYF